MRVTYRFAETPEFADVRLTVENRGRRLKLGLSGRGSLRLRPYLAAYSLWLNTVGPIEVGDEATPNIYSLYLPPIPSHALARQIEGDFRSWVLKRPTPLALTIAVTDRCQCSCPHCSAAGTGGTAPVLSGEQIRRTVAEAVALGVNVVTFTGGEPLLRDDLEECIAAVAPKEAVTLVFTNGLLLDGERARSLKAAGLHGVHVSLDSPDPDEHDKLRGRGGCFAAVAAAAQTALAAGLKVGISTYATNESVRQHRLAGIAALAAEWGAHEVTVFDAISTGRLFGRRDVHLTAAAHRDLVAQGKELTARHRARPRVVTQAWTNSGRGFARLIGCLAANFQVHVTAHGDLTPCDFTPLSFGNVRDVPVAELWRRLTTHPAFCARSKTCRMQDAAFRERYIDTIPTGATLPFPITELADR